MKKLFTSESVTEGHPDKLCDYISDSVLDEYLKLDSNARVACETVAGKNIIFITGEISSVAEVNIEKVVRNAIKEIGFDNSSTDIDYRTCKVMINISKQSPDIAIRRKTWSGIWSARSRGETWTWRSAAVPSMACRSILCWNPI